MIITDFTNIMATIGGSSIISSGITYVFAKRKYKTETDSVEIDNLKKSLSIYQDIISDFKEHINHLEKRVEKLQNKIEIMETKLSN